MPIDLPELDEVPADQRQQVLEEAVRSVNQTHGRMSNVPHYVGVALTMVIILLMFIAGYGFVAMLLASAPAYVGAMVVGIVLWRRSMVVELRRAIRQKR
jgi:hypothetical protein